MRLRKVKGAEEAIADNDYVIHEPSELKGKWNILFGNSNPIHLEIGMGKGRFITELALLHPEINYIGLERYESVLFRAIEKRELLIDELPNLYYICEDAADICDFFAPSEISRIYLNFSDPWPKERHAKRRLTSKTFFLRYDSILIPEGEVIFKTDNRPLFDFSLEQVPEAGWILRDVTFDLHKNSEYMKTNVLTEYEEKFSALGNPIFQMIAYRTTAE